MACKAIWRVSWLPAARARVTLDGAVEHRPRAGRAHLARREPSSTGSRASTAKPHRAPALAARLTSSWRSSEVPPLRVSLRDRRGVHRSHSRDL